MGLSRGGHEDEMMVKVEVKAPTMGPLLRIIVDDGFGPTRVITPRSEYQHLPIPNAPGPHCQSCERRGPFEQGRYANSNYC